MERSHRRIKYYIHILPLLVILTLIWFSCYIPKASRVIIIGLDAVDWDILNPLIEAGRLPNIKRIVEGGVTGRIESFEPSISAAVWTTISTGVTRNAHNIKDFVIPDSGRMPYNSGMRKVPAMWNIVSHYGKRVGIVGHWVSWPAEKVNGHIVSNFIAYDPERTGSIYVEGELHEVVDLTNKTYPLELAKELQPYILYEKDVTRDDIDWLFNIDDWDDPSLYEKELGVALDGLVPFFYSCDTTYFNCFDYLRHNKGPYDLLYVYIEATDSNAHRFWQFYNTTYLDEAMEHWGYDLANREKYTRYFSDTINRQYEWADERIGSVLDEMGPRDTLIIVSDHGFGPHTETACGYSLDNERHTFSGSHTHFGVIMFYGANVKKGYRLKGPPPRLTDVLPTILTLMKLPIAKYLEGYVIWDVITPRFAATYSEQKIKSYGIENQFGAQDLSNPFDEELVERMKTLGYLQ